MSKFTPGPWKVISEQTAREVEVFEVAEVTHYRVTPDRQNTFDNCGDAYCDAKLIAAAPDLYEALQELLTHAQFPPQEMQDGADPFPAHAAIINARAALAKVDA